VAVLVLPQSPTKALKIIDGLELAAIELMMSNLSKTKVTQLIFQSLSVETVQQIMSHISTSQIIAIKAIGLSTDAMIELRLSLKTAGFKENENGEFIKSSKATSAKTVTKSSLAELLTSRFSSHHDTFPDKQNLNKLRRIKSTGDDSDTAPLLESTTTRAFSH
jgi:hypothetical protein